MPRLRIEVTEDTITPMLRNLSASMRGIISDTLEETGQDMESTARILVHVRTGYLQSTIYHKVDVALLLLELGATANYAAYVEFGTRFMAAAPFIRPAFDAGQQKILDFLIHGILAAVQ